MMNDATLHDQLERLRADSGFVSIGAHVYDYETERAFSHEGDRWFHGASTVKVATSAMQMRRKVPRREERWTMLDSRGHVMVHLPDLAGRMRN